LDLKAPTKLKGGALISDHKPADKNLSRGKELEDLMINSQPNDFAEIAYALAPEIFTLVKSIGFVPPLEVLLSDSDDQLVCCLEMTAQGGFRDILDADRPLGGQFPIKVCVTDRDGRV
jgi:hypothetical protein